MSTRFAPSPTGMLHLGNLRTALLSYLWAKKCGIPFILRFDDTDRSEHKYVEAIKADLEWMQISWNYEIFQSHRKVIYDKWFTICLDKGLIYPAYETKEELEEIRKQLAKQHQAPVYKKKFSTQNEVYNRIPHWRLALPSINIGWNDMIRGKINISLDTLSDTIIKKENGEYTYMFTSVIDDIETDISYIIRGEDHVTNTSIQLYLFQKLGKQNIQFAHLPILLNVHGNRMSKRHGDESLQDLKESGLLAITLANHMLFIGKNTASYCKTIDELIKDTDFNYSSSQIRWNKDESFKIQNQIIRMMTDHEIYNTFGIKPQNWDLIKAEIITKDDLAHWNKVFSSHEILVDDELDSNLFKEQIPDVPEFLNKYGIHEFFEKIKTLSDKKTILKAIRKILTGKQLGPSMHDLLDNIPEQICTLRITSSIR
ncbi:MAG: hypothetical protein H6845_00220 [Alphaproteobacteria bacterium]|nr:MAG: hypothetical protein H6845_00220 [Alphaproteobacteria bacterium]